MPIGPARMPLFDHLGELRRRLTIVVVSVFAAAIVLYFATPVVLDILEDPIRSFVPDGKFYITTTLGGFGLRFSLAIKMAVVMCTPMIIWQILAFFLPALRAGAAWDQRENADPFSNSLFRHTLAVCGNHA